MLFSAPSLHKSINTITIFFVIVIVVTPRPRLINVVTFLTFVAFIFFITIITTSQNLTAAGLGLPTSNELLSYLYVLIRI